MTFFRFLQKTLIVPLLNPLIFETLPSVKGAFSSDFSSAFDI